MSSNRRLSSRESLLVFILELSHELLSESALTSRPNGDHANHEALNAEDHAAQKHQRVLFGKYDLECICSRVRHLSVFVLIL